MVTPHRSPAAFCIKPGPKPSLLKPHERRCVWPGCNAILARDNETLTCSCHIPGDYNVRHDPGAPQLIFELLVNACPRKIDLLDVLGTYDKDGIRDVVQKLRRHGHTITGHAVGYSYTPPAWNARQLERKARRVKAWPRQESDSQTRSTPAK